ncbi:hypothetical protein Gotri_007666 [Gossypium trilobum]|uniref:DUF4283 domain-containing protein n=1 Tax=Gossypium trilobum TaxID=34281 RepID=A0A7J9EIE6_9ROSI|nr:hypothetical protein [Gossypium trilobum]
MLRLRHQMRCPEGHEVPQLKLQHRASTFSVATWHPYGHNITPIYWSFYILVPQLTSVCHRGFQDEPPDEGGDLETLGEGTYKSLSFRDVVQKTGSMNNTMDDEWEMDDFVLREDDERKGIVDRVPSIEFSDKVYGLIEERSQNTNLVSIPWPEYQYSGCSYRYLAKVVWHLNIRLGIQAGYRVLQKPTMRLQLMGIDNVYYLAKFESDLDYNNVVSKGPWVIFSHYLILQPWLTQFSTLEAFPQYAVAWVCIVGLSRALYKRILL